METTSATTRKIRELILDLYEVGETINAFEYALRMCEALRHEEITLEQFDLLSGTLELYCKQNNIRTSNELCSLF